MLSNQHAWPKPVIHIGLPKTATTTLQRRLFAQHSEVCYLGRYILDGSPDPCHHDWACITSDVCKVMQRINLDSVHSPDIKLNRALLNSVMQMASSRQLTPVWSWESYSTDLLSRRRMRARNLKALFGEATIIICLRHPIRLIEAAYFFQLKRDNISPDYCRWRKPYYRSIDQWLEENYWHEIKPHLDYAETIRAYIKFFGMDHVHVFLYEDLVADSEKFIRRLCTVMGIDADEALALLRGASENPRMDTAQIDRLKDLSSSAWKSALFALAPAWLRAKQIGLKAGHDQPTGVKPRAMMSPEWTSRILEDVRAGNLWLNSAYSLSLDTHGYFGA